MKRLTLILTRYCLVCSLLLAYPYLASAASSDAADSCEKTGFDEQNRSATEISRHQRELFEEHSGKIIGEIVFENHNVFDETDEAEDNWLYRSLNKWHIHTRVDVVAAQLLFEVGDALNPSDISESERLLRRREYLAGAYIVLHEVCDDSVNITVYTQDSWTTEPQISFGHSGGETSSGFALSEGNILGTGNSVVIGYRKDADRSGISYHLSSPHFLNSRMEATIGYSDNSDGEDSIIDLAYPFYSLKTPQAYGLRSERLTQVESIRSQGEIVNQYRHRIERHQIYFGRAVNLPSTNTHRLLIGIANEKDQFSYTDTTVGLVPEESDLAYPWVEYQFIENQFAVYHNLDQIQRTEDVAIGKDLSLRVGYGGESKLGPVTRFIGQYSDVLAVSDEHIVRLSADVNGREYRDAGDMDSTTVGAEVAYYRLLDRNNRWFTRFRYDFGYDLQDHEKLTVGGTEGVRGYPLDFQTGKQRYIFSLERRYFSDIHLFNLVRLGGVVFFDAGRAWDEEVASASEHLSNVGLGLRISSTKAKIGHIVHVDVAFPTARKQNADSVQFRFTAEQRF